MEDEAARMEEEGEEVRESETHKAGGGKDGPSRRNWGMAECLCRSWCEQSGAAR